MLVAFKFTPIYSGRFSTGHLHWMRNLWLIIHNILYNWTTNATQSANTIGISDAAAASSASSDIHPTTTTTRTTITNVWAHFAQFGLRSFLFSILINLPSYIYTYIYIYILFYGYFWFVCKDARVGSPRAWHHSHGAYGWSSAHNKASIGMRWMRFWWKFAEILNVIFKVDFLERQIVGENEYVYVLKIVNVFFNRKS